MQKDKKELQGCFMEKEYIKVNKNAYNIFVKGEMPTKEDAKVEIIKEAEYEELDDNSKMLVINQGIIDVNDQ